MHNMGGSLYEGPFWGLAGNQHGTPIERELPILMLVMMLAMMLLCSLDQSSARIGPTSAVNSHVIDLHRCQAYKPNQQNKKSTTRVQKRKNPKPVEVKARNRGCKGGAPAGVGSCRSGPRAWVLSAPARPLIETP